MINHRVMHLLKELHPKELKSLRDFINSPFFNKSEKVAKLFERLAKDHPDIDTSKISREELHYELFPSLKYNDATLRHLFSDLCDLVEKFLTELNLKKRKAENYSFLIDELYSRNQLDIMELYLAKLESTISTCQMSGSSYFFNRFRLQTDKFNLISSIPSAFSQKNIDNSIEVLNCRIKYLVVFFTSELIKSIDAMNLISKKYNTARKKNFTNDFLSFFNIDKIINFLKSHPELSDYSFIFRAYYMLYKTFRNTESESVYFDLKIEIKSNMDKYSFEEKSYLYKKLVDYCIMKNRSKNTNTANFEIELFSVYEDILNMKLYMNFDKNVFPNDLFRNILFLSLRINRYEWAEKFIFTYSELLPQNQKMNIVNFSLASLYFEQTEYEKALLFINKIKLNNISLKLDTKSLLMRIFYEMDYVESMFSLSSAYREFLKKSRCITETRRTGHKEFIRFTEKLFGLRSTKDRSSLHFLKKEIEYTSNLINKKWLIKKVNSVILDNGSTHL